jgi:diphthamide synthase (EF-2-diphthine--ammonia ligase)
LLSVTCSSKTFGDTAKTGCAGLGSNRFSRYGDGTQERLIAEMIDGGLMARIVCGDPKKIPSDLVGHDLGYDLLRRLPQGVDPCGENGEFHTFAYSGPMFDEPIPIERGETVTRDGFLYADVLPRSIAVA